VEKIAIVTCKCNHPYQDNKYGINNRVANLAVKKSTPTVGAYRCVVCGEIHFINESGKKTVEEKKKK